MATISLPEPTTLLNSASDPLQILQLNPIYQHISFQNQNYSSAIQRLLYQLWKQKNPHAEISPPEPPPPVSSSESTVIRLVRPKSTHIIDLDSILKSKKHRKSHIKKKSSQSGADSQYVDRSSSSFNSRYSSSPLFEIRNVFTPDWKTNKLVSPKNSNNFSKADFKHLDISSIHSKIEIFEYRIQMGEDENHLHPALAINAADESSNDIMLTKVEKDKGTRYEEQKVLQKIPLFWPSRIYDKEEDKMSEHQSTQLEEKIQKEIDSVGQSKNEKQKKKIAKSRSIPLSSVLPSQNLRSNSNDKIKKVGRPPKFSSVVTFYFDNYVTDDEDLTDFDF